MWRSLRAVVVVLALASPTACGGQADDVVAVEVERSRLFEQQRSLGVTIRNGTSASVVVAEVRLGDGPYQPGPPADRTVTVPAGADVSFPVPYGGERCGDVEDELVVHLDVDGQPTSRTVPVSAQVRRAHERACAAAAARRGLSLRFADDWQLVAPRQAQGSLLAEPLGDSTVEVVDVSTAIVFVTERKDVATGRERVPLDVYAARCDTHALIESKKTFTFTVSLAIDGGEPVPVEVVPEDGPARDVLQQAIEGCLEAGGAG